MQPFEVLDRREKGQFSLSIATSLSLEGVLGIYPERENQVSRLSEAEVLYLNMQTLYRNLVGSMTKEDKAIPHPIDFAGALINELDVFVETVSNASSGGVEVVPYLCDYSSVNRRYPYALHWNPTTDTQVEANTVERNVFREIKNNGSDTPILYLDTEFQADPRHAYILTHHPINLLQRYKFSSLKLLESHTGLLKPPSQWHTKLTGLKDISSIPFDRMTLQLFGDGVMFRSMPVKLKRHLVSISEKNHWGVTTTKEKILSDIRKERDPVLEGFILKLY